MCGIVGIFSHSPVNQDLYDALTILQHRGQDAAGIVTKENGKFHLRKDNGMVRDTFTLEHMTHLLGNCGIGHVRYPTAGGSCSAEAQPLYVNSPYGIVMAHNGNLTNQEELTKELFKSDLRHVNTNSDSEVLLNVIAHELQKQGKMELTPDVLFKAIKQMYKRVRGAYAVVGMLAGYGVFGFRDPNGIRPLIYGSRKNKDGTTDYMIASESVALDALGYTIERDVKPERLYISIRTEHSTAKSATARDQKRPVFLNMFTSPALTQSLKARWFIKPAYAWASIWPRKFCANSPTTISMLSFPSLNPAAPAPWNWPIHWGLNSAKAL